MGIVGTSRGRLRLCSDRFNSVREGMSRVLRGEPGRSYRAPVWPWAIPLGGRRAIAHWRGITINGFIGYVFRKAVDLHYFLSVLSPWSALRVWWRGGWVYLQNE